MEILERLQAEAMADDVAIDLARMSCWTELQAIEYFESGGTVKPDAQDTMFEEDAQQHMQATVSAAPPTTTTMLPQSLPTASLPTPAPPTPGLPTTAPKTPMPTSQLPTAVQSDSPGGASDGGVHLQCLSIKELKARCKAAKLSTDDCSEKSDLVRRLLEGGAEMSADPAAAAAAPGSDANQTGASTDGSEWFAALTTKELRQALTRAGIDSSSCYERADFESLAREYPGAASTSTGTSVGSGGTRIGSGGGSGTAVAADFWSDYSVKQLKRLLSERHISSAGCLDRADLLDLAAQHRATLNSPVLVPTKSVEKKLSAQEVERRRKIEEGLAALGGVVHGGYQVDMFGVKRGAPLHAFCSGMERATLSRVNDTRPACAQAAASKIQSASGTRWATIRSTDARCGAWAPSCARGAAMTTWRTRTWANSRKAIRI